MDDKLIQDAVTILRGLADPVKIIVFGSRIRGDADERSDVDLLVVERVLEDRHAETVRLLRALAPLKVAFDIVVVGEQVYREWSGTPGTVLYEAAREGKVVYEAA